MSKDIEPQNQESESIVKQAFKWALTLVAIFMLVRLGVAAVILGGRVFGLLREGNLLDRINDADPTRLAVNIGVIVTVLIFFIVRSTREGKEEKPPEDDAQP